MSDLWVLALWLGSTITITVLTYGRQRAAAKRLMKLEVRSAALQRQLDDLPTTACELPTTACGMLAARVILAYVQVQKGDQDLTSLAKEVGELLDAAEAALDEGAEVTCSTKVKLALESLDTALAALEAHGVEVPPEVRDTLQLGRLVLAAARSQAEGEGEWVTT